MAVIQYSALISQIRGKLGGSVLSKFHQGFSIYRKANPSKFGSDTQQQVRNYFSAFAGTWKTLTGSERSNWNFVAANTPLYNRLNELRTISGYAYFIKYNQFLRDAGQGIVRDIAVTLNPAYAVNLTVDNYTAGAGDQNFVIGSLRAVIITLSNSLNPNSAILYASLPKAYTDFKYYQSWYRVAILVIPANLGPTTFQTYNLENIQMPAGWKVFSNGDTAFRLEIVNQASGQFSASSLAYDQVDVLPVSFFPRLIAPEPFVDNVVGRETASIAFWDVWWRKQNIGSDPILFEMNVAAYIGTQPFSNAQNLAYNNVITRPILKPSTNNLYILYSVSNDELMGENLAAAFSSNLPSAGPGVKLILRMRTRLLTGGNWSPFAYQEFGYQQI